MREPSTEVLDVVRSARDELHRILESEQYLMGSIIVSVVFLLSI